MTRSNDTIITELSSCCIRFMIIKKIKSYNTALIVASEEGHRKKVNIEENAKEFA